MNSKFYYTLLLISIWIFGCNSNHSVTRSPEQNDTLKNSLVEKKGFQIWQLDYYPDSILLHRSISDNSGWGSAYAYNIQFSEDSCQFIGWHESWWNQLTNTKEKEYKTKGDESQYWELKFISSEKLLMRQISKRDEKTEIGKFAPYHKVNKLLTLDHLDHIISKRIFAGVYLVTFHDTLVCDKLVTLDNNFGVKGINGVESYSFETAIDWDFPVYNAFGFNKKGEFNNKGLSYKFSGDTLLIKDYKIIQRDGDFDHVEIAKTRIKMIKE